MTSSKVYTVLLLWMSAVVAPNGVHAIAGTVSTLQATTMVGRGATLVLNGTHFSTTNKVEVGGVACVFGEEDLDVSPCRLQSTRTEVCITSGAEFDYYGLFDPDGWIPCDFEPDCIMASDSSPCPDLGTVSMCQVHRCTHPDVGQCFGFDNAPNGMFCGGGLACHEGVCESARGDECATTLTCSLPSDHALGSGLHDVVLRDEFNATLYNLTGAFEVIPSIDISNLDPDPDGEFHTPTVIVCATNTSTSSPEGERLHLVFFFNGTRGIPNGSRCAVVPDLGARDDLLRAVLVEVSAYDPDSARVEEFPLDFSTTLTYGAAPTVLSAFPQGIPIFSPVDIVVSGQFFIDSPALTCFLAVNGAALAMPTTYVHSSAVICEITVSKAVDTALVAVVNHPAAAPTGLVSVSVIGECRTVRRNSTAIDGACKCDPGFYEAASGADCVPCADGFYQFAYGQQLCLPCPESQDTAGRVGSTSTDACVCRPGFYPTLDTSVDESASEFRCDPCPQGLLCDGGGSSRVQAGYWRAEDGTAPIACLPGSAGCRGGSYGDDVCAEGYEGPLCEVCAPKYAKIAGRCEKCGSELLNVFIVLVIVVMAGAACAVIVKSTAEDSTEGRRLSTISKIFVNFMQHLYYVGRLAAGWGPMSARLLSVASFSSISGEFFPINCSLSVNFYQAMALTMAMPPLISVVVYGGVRLGETFRVIREKTAARAVLIVLYMMHPAIALDVFSSLNCRAVEGTGTAYVRDNMAIDCGSGTYRTYAICAGIFCVVYIFGAPALFLRYFFSRKEAVQSEMAAGRGADRHTITSFFTVGFSIKCYYWEVVVMARKLAIVAAAAAFGAEMQLLWTITILGCMFAVTYTTRPFVLPEMNHAELGALGSLFVVCATAAHLRASSNDNRITGAADVLIFLVILIVSILAAGGFMVRLLIRDLWGLASTRLTRDRSSGVAMYSMPTARKGSVGSVDHTRGRADSQVFRSDTLDFVQQI